MWMWLLPIGVRDKGEGIYYPRVPELGINDLNVVLKQASKEHNTSFSINDFEHDPLDYINKGVNKYAGRTFEVAGEVIETDAQPQENILKGLHDERQD